MDGREWGCGGKPGKPGAIREMTWTEDPPVCVGYCKGCADCDPTGSRRESAKRKAVHDERAQIAGRLRELRAEIRRLSARDADLSASAATFTQEGGV